MTLWLFSHKSQVTAERWLLCFSSNEIDEIKFFKSSPQALFRVQSPSERYHGGWQIATLSICMRWCQLYHWFRERKSFFSLIWTELHLSRLSTILSFFCRMHKNFYDFFILDYFTFIADRLDYYDGKRHYQVSLFVFSEAPLLKILTHICFPWEKHLWIGSLDNKSYQICRG